MRSACIILTLIFCSFCSERLYAEVPSELGVGVPPFSDNASLFDDQSIAMRLIRSSLSDSLLKLNNSQTGKKALTSLALADSFQVDSDLLHWSYRLRNAVVFANGQSLRAVDVCDSLMKCEERRLLGAHIDKNFSLDACKVRAEQIGGLVREWVDISFSLDQSLIERQQSVTTFIAQCPMLERRTREVFAGSYGVGSNFLGAGDYRIVSFNPGREYRLERYQRVNDGRSISPQIVDIRGFSSSRDALAALRVGTIALFIEADPETIAAAQNDETLRVGECNGKNVVYRRGIEFECQESIKLSSITWKLPTDEL